MGKEECRSEPKPKAKKKPRTSEEQEQQDLLFGGTFVLQNYLQEKKFKDQQRAFYSRVLFIFDFKWCFGVFDYKNGYQDIKQDPREPKEEEPVDFSGNWTQEPCFSDKFWILRAGYKKLIFLTTKNCKKTSKYFLKTSRKQLLGDIIFI